MRYPIFPATTWPRVACVIALHRRPDSVNGDIVQAVVYACKHGTYHDAP